MRLRPWLPPVLAAVALVCAGTAAGVAGGVEGDFTSRIGDFSWLGRADQIKTVDQRKEEEGVFGFRESGFDTDLWVTLAGSVIVALLLVTAGAILYTILKHLLRDRGAPPRTAARGPAMELEEDTEQARAAVLAGLAELDEGDDPRRAVIACWLRLERAAAEAGVPRRVSDTPADLVARLLGGEGVEREALDELAGAYRLARYAPHDVPEELRATARRALSLLAFGGSRA
ncbi:DUF4129 domain-containing protein [Thermoactinospora rubra]|uniref:DUF4129 domain-containing protein n=1 Tax=Thermoactinospora rubra TaxID=1088767 RepID=UPI000A104285|nr:DUF4129 domain-containing protein [Thermoactinospora rubra]